MKTPPAAPDTTPPQYATAEPPPPEPAPPAPAPPEPPPVPDVPQPVSPGIVAAVGQVRTPRELELETRIATLEDENQRLRSVQGAPPRKRRWSDDLL